MVGCIVGVNPGCNVGSSSGTSGHAIGNTGRGGTAGRLGGGGGGGGPSKEAFFASLSADAFAPAEEAMRDAVFEFLASWRSQDLATLRHLGEHPEVKRRSAAFLPRSVPLKDWIEHRIGGELEFRGNRGAEVIHLMGAAKDAVMVKYQQMQHGLPPMPPMGPPMGPPMMPPHMGVLPPPMGPPPGMMGAPAMGPHPKDAWFSSLPADELLPAELELRDAILHWLNNWQRPANRPAGSTAHLSDTGQDEKIKRARQDFLPPKIKLADWIERRIGGEVELRSVGNGQHEVFVRGAPPPETSSRGPRVSAVAAAARQENKAATAEEKDRFFESLPVDEFGPAEDAMREVLLNYLDRYSGNGAASLHEAAQEEEIARVRRDLLPKGCPVSLKDWIDRRIGGEIETRVEGDGSKGSGKVVFGQRGLLPPATGGAGGAKRRRA
mmetsp:Transcript_86616/g.248476  ORF Transcript_86616/g.248476 Transcript_86616/m.248476 type:complete len:437 (-) Transcript_86616:118-1428(-)